MCKRCSRSCRYLRRASDRSVVSQIIPPSGECAEQLLALTYPIKMKRGKCARQTYRRQPGRIFLLPQSVGKTVAVRRAANQNQIDVAARDDLMRDPLITAFKAVGICDRGWNFVGRADNLKIRSP